MMPTNRKLPIAAALCRDDACLGDRRVQTVLQAVQAAPARDLSCLATMVGLSTSRLSHLFKRETGYDLRSFVTASRLLQASRLLREGAMPVKEISYHVGYRHPASFIRAFRKEFGSAPARYRGLQQLLHVNSGLR